MQFLYGSNNTCHYGEFGYGILGADAAYHMYRSLHGKDVRIVVSDTSGHADIQTVLTNGQTADIDITWLKKDLTFRADCGSTSGTLSFAR